jgi:hypothetical protein
VPLPFETVREQLLRAGIAPRHANRYVTELREHLADLTERDITGGADATQATARAISAIGNDRQLAQAMIDKRPPRSWAARAPWAVFTIVPVLVLAAVICGTAASMMHLLSPVQGLALSQMPESYRAFIKVVGFSVNFLVTPLLAAGCLVVALRQRLQSRWFWLGLALIAAFSGIFGFHTHAIPAPDGHEAGARFSVAGIVYLHGRANLAATVAPAALRAIVLFAMTAVAYRSLRMRVPSFHT